MQIARRASLLGLTVVAVLVATPVLLGAGSGQARTERVALSCGQTVTTSVTLTADMFCPGGDGVDVGANGIIVNLNGHTISGDTTHIGVLDDGHTGVVIENGVVKNFAFGVVLVSGASGTVQNVRSENNPNVDIRVVGNNSSISGDYAFESNFGIEIGQGSGVKVTGNWAAGNAGTGIAVEGATGVSVLGNKATNNGTGIDMVSIGSGLLSGNVADGNSSNGIFLSSSAGGVKSPLTASNNRAAFNGQFGITSTAGGSTDGGGNVVQDNGNAAQCANIICHEVIN
jgi:parallel beta-helix repeat protein